MQGLSFPIMFLLFEYQTTSGGKHFSLTCRYNVEEEGGCDELDQGDNGWKIIHTDVFRFPPYKSLLCAVLGVGAQFLTLATGDYLFSNTHKDSYTHD